MGSPLGFMPPPPKGMTMPPGYELWGEVGMGERGAVYYWSREVDDPLDLTDDDLGPDVLDKRTAVRHAWADYKRRAAATGDEG
jgi:hypothetical protein